MLDGVYWNCIILVLFSVSLTIFKYKKIIFYEHAKLAQWMMNEIQKDVIF